MTAADVSAESPPRLPSWLGSLEARFPARPAIQALLTGDSLTFADLQARSSRLAGAFRGLGLQPGDAIAIWLPNRPDWMAIHFAAARAGLLTVPLNTWFRESEVCHFVRIARCRAIIVDPSFRGIDFRGILDRTIATLSNEGGCPLEWVIETGPRDDCRAASGGPRRVALSTIESGSPSSWSDAGDENTAMIAYSTSGTTSAPKLAVHREGALLAHAGAVARRAHMTADDVVLGALPPCGAYGYTLLMAAMAAGARALVMEEFELDALVSAISSERVTMIAVTEPIMRKLLDDPRASRKAFESLRLVFSAGGTLAPVVERAEREFNFCVSNVYGSSEILALAAFWGCERKAAERSEAGGRLTSEGMRVRAVDGGGRALPPGTQGELQFSGPIVTRGYLGNPAADRKAFTADGWFRSSDLGFVVTGSSSEFRYVARLNDALRIKGFLVNPGEIEAMLQTHPAVAAAQVVGIPDGLGEELAAAFIVARKGEAVSEAELAALCHARMASYKCPAILKVIEEFPVTRSANGDKVMKGKLREMAALLHAS